MVVRFRASRVQRTERYFAGLQLTWRLLAVLNTPESYVGRRAVCTYQPCGRMGRSVVLEAGTTKCFPSLTQLTFSPEREGEVKP